MKIPEWAAKLFTRIAYTPKALEELEGKTILSGLTFLDKNGALVEQYQLYGRVVRANEREGVVLHRPDGSGFFFLPPSPLKAYSKAVRGEYTLRGTGEVVSDPDFTTSWTVDLHENNFEAIDHFKMNGFGPFEPAEK